MGALANLLSRLLAVLALNRMKGRVKLLKESLALLASEPDVQLAHLRDLGVPDHVDELALEHDDIAPVRIVTVDRDAFRIRRNVNAAVDARRPYRFEDLTRSADPGKLPL